MIKAVIVDDELKAQKNLFNLIREYTPQVEVMAMEGSVEDGKSAILKFKPEIVFLDVEMENETGFDLLESMEEIDFDVVFVTAHDEYAIRAFKISALDYLLKPINIEELVEAVKKVEQKKGGGINQERIDLILENLSKKNSRIEKIVLPTLESLIFVQVEDIIRCESLDNYTNFHLKSGKVILVSKNIKYYEDILEDHNFFRVHRSHLINLNYIKEYYKGEGGYVIMSDSSDVPVSRRKKTQFLNKFTNMS